MQAYNMIIYVPKINNNINIKLFNFEKIVHKFAIKPENLLLGKQ